MAGHFPEHAPHDPPSGVAERASPGPRRFRPALLDVTRTGSPAGDGFAIALRSLTARGPVPGPSVAATPAPGEREDPVRFASETEAVILVTREQGMRLLADLAAAMGMMAAPPATPAPDLSRSAAESPPGPPGAPAASPPGPPWVPAASPPGPPGAPAAPMSDRSATPVDLEARIAAPMVAADGPAAGAAKPAAGPARFGQQPLFQPDAAHAGDAPPRRAFGKRVLDPLGMPASQDLPPGGAARPVDAPPVVGRPRIAGLVIAALLLTGAMVAGAWLAGPVLTPIAERLGLAAEPARLALDPAASEAAPAEPPREEASLAPPPAFPGAAVVPAVAVAPAPPHAQAPGQDIDQDAGQPLSPPLTAATQDQSASAPGLPQDGSAAGSPPAATAAPAPRLLLRVRSDSWVQVRDGRGEILLARMMRAGEEWVPPATGGLRLTTGNAAGTEIVVDGVALPPLGPAGQVRRDVPLEPRRP